MALSIKLEQNGARLSRPPASKLSLSSKSQKIEVNSMEIERGSLRHLKMSENVVETLLQSRKNLTITTYLWVWKAFLRMAAEKKQNPLSPSVSNVLDFLQAA